MNKKKLIIYLIFTSILFIWFIWYFFIYQKKETNRENTYDVLVKNNSWNTSLWESIPYKKDEEIELNILFSWDSKKKISLDLERIKNKLDIKKIFIDDSESSLDNITIQDSQNIKIIWDTLWDGILKKEDYQDIIQDIEEIKEESLKEDDIKKDQEINIKFDKKIFNSNINNLTEITGTGKEFIKYINIWEVSLTPIHEDNKTFLSISKNTFHSWEYFIIVQLENNELITLNEKITFHFSPSKVNIANITPHKIKNDIDRNIVLQWNGFSKIISLQLSNNIILKNTSFQIINDHVMSVLVPKDLKSGKYYLNIMTIDGIHELKDITFTINN